jgi:hypothetical protein
MPRNKGQIESELNTFFRLPSVMLLKAATWLSPHRITSSQLWASHQ